MSVCVCGSVSGVCMCVSVCVCGCLSVCGGNVSGCLCVCVCVGLCELVGVCVCVCEWLCASEYLCAGLVAHHCGKGLTHLLGGWRYIYGHGFRDTLWECLLMLALSPPSRRRWTRVERELSQVTWLLIRSFCVHLFCAAP